MNTLGNDLNGLQHHPIVHGCISSTDTTSPMFNVNTYSRTVKVDKNTLFQIDDLTISGEEIKNLLKSLQKIIEQDYPEHRY